MRKLFLLLLVTLFSASALAQSGRRATAPTPKPLEPPVQAPADAEPEVRPEPPGEMLVLPQSLLNRKLKGLESGDFSLADYDNRVVVLNLWASWCGPCRMEVPEYERVRKEYAGRGVEFIALTTEDPNDSSDRVKKFVRDFKFGFRMGWADRETAVTLMNGRSVIPQTYVIAPGGRIVSHWRGYSPGRSGDRLRQVLASALSQEGSAQTR